MSGALVSENILFKQYRASTYYNSHIGQLLDAALPTSWMGRGGSTAWPAHSPDLIPLNLARSGFEKRITKNDELI